MAAYQSTYRFARISARKVRPIADLIRGKMADEALTILQFQPQRGRGCWRRCSKVPWATPRTRIIPRTRAAASTCTVWSSARPTSTAVRCSNVFVLTPAAWRS